MKVCPKIFVIYHKPFEVFKNDVFVPIQTGTAFSDVDLGFMKDTGGDNIGKKNHQYGELTAWYWIMQNYLPQHPEITHVGFCHYRRFLEYCPTQRKKLPFSKILTSDFSQMFNSESYAKDTVRKAIADYDILLPAQEHLFTWRFRFIRSVRSQFTYMHPKEDLSHMEQCYARLYPESKQTIAKFLDSTKMYTCLNFVMQKELFVDMVKTILSVLDLVSSEYGWSGNQDYRTIRSPAFLAERFFNVWLMEKSRKMPLKIKEVNSYLLCDSLDSTITMRMWIDAIAARAKHLIYSK